MSLPTGPLQVTAAQWRDIREHYEDPPCSEPRYLFVYDAELSIPANSQEEADARLPEAVQHIEQLKGICLNVLDNCETIDVETGEPVDLDWSDAIAAEELGLDEPRCPNCGHPSTGLCYDCEPSQDSHLEAQYDEAQGDIEPF